MTQSRLPRLMLIADQIGAGERPLADLVAQVSRALDDDLFVQFRERELSDEALVALIEEVRTHANPSLSVNDRPKVAELLGIGLHLPARASRPTRRNELPPLGRSVHDGAEARQALSDRVDYAVVGTIFETTSHPGRTGAGLEHLSRMVTLLDQMPCYAIGGMTTQTAPQAIVAGAWGVAVRSAILSADDPARAARRLRDSLPA